MAVEIKKSILVQQVQDGWKRKALAEHYGLPEAQMAQVLRNAGLQIRNKQNTLEQNTLALKIKNYRKQNF